MVVTMINVFAVTEDQVDDFLNRRSESTRVYARPRGSSRRTAIVIRRRQPNVQLHQHSVLGSVAQAHGDSVSLVSASSGRVRRDYHD